MGLENHINSLYGSQLSALIGNANWFEFFVTCQLPESYQIIAFLNIVVTPSSV